MPRECFTHLEVENHHPVRLRLGINSYCYLEVGPKKDVQTSLNPFKVKQEFRIDPIVDVEVSAKPTIQKSYVEIRK